MSGGLLNNVIQGISGDGQGAQLQFSLNSCARCGVQFALTVDFERQRRDDGEVFYCPNGHQLVFSPSEADKLRELVEQKDAELERRGRQIQEERYYKNHYKRSAQTYKGQVTKLKKRA